MTLVKSVLLAAGGTGGHVAPALALADELIKRQIPVILATDRRGIQFVTPRPGLTVHLIRAGTLRKNPVRLIKDLWSLVVGVLQSFDLLRDYHPGVVVGFGGYPCFPPVLAAQIIGVPTLLHEQNAVIGRANAMLAKLCTQLALSLPDFTGLSSRQKARTLVTGRPVPAAIDALYTRIYQPSKNDETFNVVILGGSQGAKILSQDIPRALTNLPPPLRTRLNLTHQVLAADVENVKNLYAQAGVKAEIAPFFKDIPDKLKTAHLFIGRSGGTVTEISIAGIPAIYLPYPHHKDQQQLKNAQVIERAGGAFILMEPHYTDESFLAPFMELMLNPELASKMATAARTCGHPHAAQKLADATVALMTRS